jgi:hypothetical protein
MDRVVGFVILISYVQGLILPNGEEIITPVIPLKGDKEVVLLYNI